MDSIPECSFNINRPSIDETKPRGVSTDLSLIKCEGLRQRVSDAIKGVKKSIESQDFSSLSELLVFRANAEIATEDEVADRIICKAHLDFLVTNWPDKHKGQKKERKRKGLNESQCVLPHEGDPPKETRKASKKFVLWWLKNHNQFIHIGSGLCSAHRKLMSESVTIDDHLIIAKRTLPQRINVDEEWMDSYENQMNSDYDDNPNDHYSETVRDEISFHFNEIAKRLSSTSFYSETDWNVAAEDTKRKKIALACRIFETMCECIAENGRDDIISSVVQKYSTQGNDSGCAEQILSAVGERFANAQNRRSRLEVLATLVDVPYFSSYKVLLTIPGVNRYLIHQSRLFARGGLDLDTKYIRVRYCEAAILFFISFLVRSNALTSIAWITNTATKSDGSKIDLASTIRTQTFARIIRQYIEFLKTENKSKEESISAGTAFAILKAVVPRMSTRTTCVDEFACVANEAWRQLEVIVQDSGNMGILTTSEQNDLIRRLRLCKSFLECDFRHHIEISSHVLQHCATLALSDSGNKAYRSKCDHNHDAECADCMQVYRTLALIKSRLADASLDLSDNEQHEVDRWLQLLVKCKSDLSAYIAHIIRGVVSDCAKLDVQNDLKEGECLLTLDWAQKILPQSAEESQSQFYAKVGISLHVAHAATVKAGEKVHHSFLHTIDCCVQDSNSVSAISKHCLSELKENGIEKVVMRSCYKSAGIIGDIACLIDDLPTVLAIIYSESQMGKGPCDRTTSHCKRKIREETNGLKNCLDAADVFKAITGKEPIRGTSAYHCTIDGASDDCEVKKIPDISTIYDVRFEGKNVITRKHTGIGSGIVNTNLKPLNSKVNVLSQGGFLSKDNFWASYGDTKTLVNSVTEPDKKGNDDELLDQKNVFFCSTPGCSKVFTTLARLESHEMKGTHKIRQKNDTLLDFAISKFSDYVENEEAARIKVTTDSFQNTTIDNNNDDFKEGYGMKKIRKNGISKDARAAAEEYFWKHRNTDPPRRACPRTFSQSMVSMRDNTGRYQFKVSELLSEKQVQGLFSRLEKRRTSGISVAKKNRKDVSKTVTSKSRKRKYAEIHVDGILNDSDDDDNEENEDEDKGAQEDEDEMEFLQSIIMEEKDQLFL